MARTLSNMLELGTSAPDFNLPEPATGATVSLADVSGARALVVAFICNHCPYVIHIREGFAAMARDYEHRDVRVVAINSNDATSYPADSPERMAEEVREFDYSFPYLFDADQTVARRYQATCTPDLYLFDAQLALVYRGQFDDSRPGNGRTVTGQDLRAAIDAVLAGKQPSSEQKPSVGCSIKWKPGNSPEYPS